MCEHVYFKVRLVLEHFSTAITGESSNNVALVYFLVVSLQGRPRAQNLQAVFALELSQNLQHLCTYKFGSTITEREFYNSWTLYLHLVIVVIFLKFKTLTFDVISVLCEDESTNLACCVIIWCSCCGDKDVFYKTIKYFINFFWV